VTNTQALTGEPTLTIKFVFEAEWPLEEFNGKVKAYKAAVAGKTKGIVAKTRPPDSTGSGRASTKPLRQGGQKNFRAEIQAFIEEKVSKPAHKSTATRIMKGLQADHRLDLQSGGLDEGANFSMIQSKMNGTMGSQLNAALNDAKIGPDAKITKVEANTDAAGRAKNLGASSTALELQGILLNYAEDVATSKKIKGWFNLG
jgi:hypothetical protein